MSKSKRRPGGGRKPIGEFSKSAAFTTRLDPTLRRALVEAAEHSGKSVSETAAHILREGLKRPSGEPHNRALACAVALIGEKIEREAQKSWRDDQFTRQALAYGIETLLAYIAPDVKEAPPIPPAIEAAAAKSPPQYAEQYRKPDFFGFLQASNLINEIEQAAPGRLINEWSLPIFFSEKPMQLALIGRDLGLTAKKGKSK
jgi:plasmid stability protein